MSQFTPTKRGNPCPICANESGKCRTFADSPIILCMTADRHESVPGYRFTKPSKDGLWGVWTPDDGHSTEADRQQWQLDQQRKREERQREEAQRQADAMSAVERDRYYRDLLSLLPLRSDDRADLTKRGLTPEEIAAWGVVSVERWQTLETELPHTLPGVTLDGRSLNNYHAGYIVPIQSPSGEITAFQIANRDRSGDGPKYPWLTSKTSKRPNGATAHLPNGELPLAVAFPSEPNIDKLGQIGLCEGTGIKPRLAAERLGIPVIGASGGNFAASPELLKSYLQELIAQCESKQKSKQRSNVLSFTNKETAQSTCQDSAKEQSSEDGETLRSNTPSGKELPETDLSGLSKIILIPDAGAVQNQNVLRQYRATWKLLQQWGYQVEVLWWGQAEKSDQDIDELTTLEGIQQLSTAQFEAIVHSTRPLKSAQRLEAALEPPDRKQKALQVIAKLNRLSYPVERATEGEYLPALPQLQPGAIHVLNASMNAGKTTRIGQDWVKWAIAQGWNVLVLAPLNSLGEQTAQDWELPHIHTYGTSKDQQQALWADVSHSHGLVLCPNSLHRLPPWFFDRPLLLVLDEANQVILHQAQGDTLKSRQAEILERFTQVSRHAINTGAIVLSEDGLPDRAVKFTQQVSGGATVRTFTHQKQSKPWNCTVYRGQASGYRARFLQSLKPEQPKLFVASSQAEAERMERAIARCHPGLKVARIDSKTNQKGFYSQFFTDPDQWLYANRPDVLILSPTVKSGVSIEGGISAENAYFKEVWGYFSTLETDTHAQLLGRYRPPVPRVIFCPDFVLTSGDESLLYPRAIKRRLHSNARALAGVYGIEELLEATDDRAEILATIEIATLDYLTEAIAVAGAQKQIARQALINRLEQAGHCVVSEQIKKDSNAVTLWKEVQEEIWRGDAGAIASGVIDPQIHTPKWARQTLDSLEASLEDRTLARKVLWREEFPGVDFDDPEEVYQALVKDYGAMRRGVTLQAKAENLDAAREDDRVATEAILKGDIRALHRLPKGYVRARLIAQTGILALLDGGTYGNTDPRAIAVKEAALKLAREISYWLRLQVKETQTPVEIVNKLLKKLGLAAIAVSRPGARGQQNDRLYQVSSQDNPIRVRLLEALRRKLSGSVSTIRKEENQFIQIVDTAPQKPPDPDNWLSPECLSDIRQWWQTAESEEVREDLQSWVPPEVLRRAIV